MTIDSVRSPLGFAILDHLDHYLSDGWSPQEFDDSFVPMTWDIDHSIDEAATDLAHPIILYQMLT